ncbi:hypothetical protein FB451DRAFT_1250380 [Mycena latifolia]|nr:hypothetical protein FB451DRAFT_1250380 [Mycena latifolia]
MDAQDIPSDGRPFRPATVIPSLPLEITDHIIDLVASQRIKKLRGNLAACSMVCRDWTARSRMHFFSDCRLLLHYRNTAAFGKLLRSPYCTILPHVRLLTMENDGACIFDSIKDELKLLVRVESLKLSGSSWAVHGAAPRRGFMASLATIFPALRRLSLPHLPMPPRGSEEYGSLFEPYPPYTPPPWIQPNEHLLRPPTLSSLSITASATIPILHWLNWTGSCRLTGLELELPYTLKSWNTPPLVQFVHNARASLEHFIFSSAVTNLDNLAEVLDLSSFENLRTLRFDHLLSYGDLVSLDRSLVSIIRSITSSVLETVSFVFDDHKPFKRILWSELDEFFTNSDFPKLKCVRFSSEWMYTAADIAGFAAAVKQAFPRTDDRGLLQIDFPTRFLIDAVEVNTQEGTIAESLAYISELIPL